MSDMLVQLKKGVSGAKTVPAVSDEEHELQ